MDDVRGKKWPGAPVTAPPIPRQAGIVGRWWERLTLHQALVIAAVIAGLVTLAATRYETTAIGNGAVIIQDNWFGGRQLCRPNLCLEINTYVADSPNPAATPAKRSAEKFLAQ